ncbi:25747_t:CDS:1, partial [Dentiscutata erythropus]
LRKPQKPTTQQVTERNRRTEEAIWEQEDLQTRNNWEATF